MRKRTSLILAAGLAVPAVIGVVACRAKRSDASAAEIPSAGVATVTRGTISHTLNLAGQFQSYQVIDVHAKVSGYIRHIYVDIGDKVRQGQILAVLEVPELSAQLKGTVSQVARSQDEINRAQNEVLGAESQHSSLHADYGRLKQAAAVQPGLIAEQELDDAHAKDLAAESAVDAAKSALAAAKQESAVDSADNERVSALADYTRVVAPIDGVIIWRYADTGALIQAGTTSDVQSLPVVKLSQSNLLRLRIPVPEDAVEYIRVGAEVNVRVDAVHRSLVGKVVRFTRDVSMATRTMETEIDVENKDLSLTPGMYANTTLELERRNDVLTIPVQAVITDGNQSSVLVVDSQNHVRVQSVTLGLQGSNLVEVKNGLAEGERVITGGQSNYQGGETVKPKLEPLPIADVNEESRGANINA